MVGPGYTWIAGDGIGSSTILGEGAVSQIHGMGRLTSKGGVAGNANFDAFATAWTGFDSDTNLKAYAEKVRADPLHPTHPTHHTT